MHIYFLFINSRYLRTVSCISKYIPSCIAKSITRTREWIDRQEEFSNLPGFSCQLEDCTFASESISSTYAEHLATGKKTAAEASELLKAVDEFERIVRVSKNVKDPSYDMFWLHIHYFRMSMVQLFAHPLWLNGPINIEPLHQPNLPEIANSALEHVETRMKHVGLESFIFIDHLVVIGVFTLSSLDRLRVMSLLDSIKRRGLVFAEVFIEDLQLAWNAVPLRSAII